MNEITDIMRQIIVPILISAIIVLQPEIRIIIKRLKNRCRKFICLLLQSKKDLKIDDKIIRAIDGAIQYLSKKKIGAIITIERNDSLEEYIETGVELNAEISEELLVNIFIPNTPLHDGAVIVRNGKVVVASAYLPLTRNVCIPRKFGTRHRCAIGVSENTDALTIIVSEETGGVSVTIDNELITNLTQEQYLNLLCRELCNL